MGPQGDYGKALRPNAADDAARRLKPTCGAGRSLGGAPAHTSRARPEHQPYSRAPARAGAVRRVPGPIPLLPALTRSLHAASVFPTRESFHSRDCRLRRAPMEAVGLLVSVQFFQLEAMWKIRTGSGKAQQEPTSQLTSA